MRNNNIYINTISRSPIGVSTLTEILVNLSKVSGMDIVRAKNKFERLKVSYLWFLIS